MSQRRPEHKPCAELLAIENVSVRFGALRAVDNVSFTIARGGITGLIGPNGAGKSTLLTVLAGVLQPSQGRVRLAGQILSRKSTAQICRLGMCMTHQTPRPFGELEVRANLAVAAAFGGRGAHDRIDSVLALCGLSALAGARADTLGPSELRRLELARALATDPSVLLLDEVAAGMPSEEINEMAGTLRRIRSTGVTIVLVEHVMDLLLQVAERLIVLDQGAMIADGPPQQVLGDSRVVTAYFGEELV